VLSIEHDPINRPSTTLRVPEVEERSKQKRYENKHIHPHKGHLSWKAECSRQRGKQIQVTEESHKAGDKVKQDRHQRTMRLICD
jgi:hypothetical protein